MTFCTGNFVNGLAIKLQYRVFRMNWVKGNNAARCCTKGRDYSRSFPVKYIPKKFSKSEEDGTASLSVKYVQKRHKGPELNLARTSFSTYSSEGYLDVNSKNLGACRASDIYELNLEMDEENEGDIMASNDGFIEETEDIAEDNIESRRGIQSGPNRQAVEKLAIVLLASRAFTALELKKKLQAKRFPLDIVEAVVSDFQSKGLINDCLYAETYSRSRWSSSSWGPRRLRQVLSKKGISEVDTRKAIKLVFDSKEGCDSGISMSRPAFDQLYDAVSKQWQRSCGAPRYTRKSRIIRWLRYRGFDWNVVSYVLKKLESEEPS